jgi:transglutaminase-like putative cysteine protease
MVWGQYMRSILTVAVAVLTLLPCAAFPKDEGVMTGAIPVWAQLSEPMAVPDAARGPLFVRRNNVEIHIDKSGQYIFVGMLAKLLDTSALQLGNFAISWNPAAGRPIVHTIKIHRSGVERDVLAGAKFELLRREDQLEAAALDGVLTAVLHIPDLRVGDELELAYTLPSHDPTLRSISYGFLFLAPVPPPGRMGLRLSWERGEEPLLRPTPDLAESLNREPQAVSLAFDQPSALTPPKDAPPRYGWQRALEFSDFASWQALSTRMMPLFETASTLSAESAVRSEAAAIAAAHSTPLERAAAALALVQQQVRYVFVGLNGGNLTPTSAEETWRRRYGDCKGKTALLLALLKELGVQAEPVLVNNSGGDDGIDSRLASPGMFDHVLVRARIEGKSYWLDGTLPVDYRATEVPVLPYRWVLPLSAAGAPIERIVWQPDAKPSLLMLLDVDARAGFDEPAKTRMVTVIRGRGGLAQYFQFSQVSENQLEEGVRKELEGSDSWTTIERVSWHFDPVEQASVLEITGTGPVDWENAGNKSRSLAVPGGGFSPPRRRLRGSGQDTAVPFFIEPEFDCRVTTVHLPSATAEKDWSYNTTFDRVMFGQTFRRSFEKRDGTIRMIRSNRTLLTEIDGAAATRDNALIAAFDNSMARIFYDPGSIDSTKRTERVPAADEVDWVRDSSACLAPQTLAR